jgi:copper resistance protein D
MYQWIVYLHLIAAVVWIGGMFFLPLVLVPVVRREDARTRALLMSAVGQRFRTVGWVMIAVLLVTGVWNLFNRQIPLAAILSPELFRGAWGHVLAAKLALVAAILVLSAVHDFWIGPTSTRAGQGDDRARAERLRRLASWLGRLNALLALAVLWLAVMLVRGLP